MRGVVKVNMFSGERGTELREGEVVKEGKRGGKGNRICNR